MTMSYFGIFAASFQSSPPNLSAVVPPALGAPVKSPPEPLNTWMWPAVLAPGTNSLSSMPMPRRRHSSASQPPAVTAMCGMSPSRAVLRQAELAIGDLVRFALLRDAELQLAAPLADLDDDRDVLVDGHVLQLELTLRVGERADHRAERDARAGLAADALGDRGELGVAVRAAGDVDHDVVERVRAGRVVDLARDRRRRVLVVALLALAREALTGNRAGRERARRPRSRRLPVRLP